MLLSLLESVVLGFHGYYNDEVAGVTIPLGRLFNKTSPGQSSHHYLILELILPLENLVLTANFSSP
ncbi:hypothetical protein [Nostoc foliaceum]|uniref:hypothetical protein n=1 Tax=Nostoc foliaceum TaxID=2692914 RepID=UPI0016840C77|nr:hypothetical protein [Nostoc foliaceum]